MECPGHEAGLLTTKHQFRLVTQTLLLARVKFRISCSRHSLRRHDTICTLSLHTPVLLVKGTFHEGIEEGTVQYLHLFLSSTMIEYDSSASHPSLFTPERSLVAH